METASLTFGSPLWLWGLAALPVLAAMHWWSHRRGVALVSRIVAPRLRNELAGSVSTGRRVVRAVLVLLAFAFLFVALAKPRTGFTEIETKSKGRDVLVAIDTSRSMLATDVAPTRLARAKLLTQDLLRLVRGDRVGLIAFAGSAFLQAPLTLDYSAVLNSLEELDTNVIPKGGTNIAAAIQTAEQAFGKAEGTVRALVILTDGEELDADGVAAAARARELGIRIFTVGIGSAEGSLIPIRTPEGRQDFVRDAAGKPVQSRLDSARLSEIAEASGGFYSALGVDTAREIVQNGIEPIERSETGSLASRQPIEAYRYPLGAAIVLLVVWMLLSERRRAPRLAVRAAFVLLLFPGQVFADGLQAFQSGNFPAARADFEKRLESSPEWREMQFNAGAAAYKMDDFEQAISHFTKALLAEPTDLRAKAAYNLANSLVRRGERAQDREAKKTDWTSAIEHYTEALNLQPDNKQAQENREIVKKMLEELEREQKQEDQQKQDQQQDQDKKDDQKQDQQNKDQQNQDQQNKDQQDQQQDQQKKDQQNQQGGDSKDQKDQQNQGEQKKDPSEGGESDSQKPRDEKKPEDQKDGDEKKDEPSQGGQPSPTPVPTPSEKKEGDLKSGTGDKPEQQQQSAGGQPAGEEEAEKEGEMSAAQARALLNSLRSEEEKVNLMQQQTSQDVLRDW